MDTIDAIMTGPLKDEERAYVTELTTFSMQRLEKEPHKLDVENYRLQNEIEQLAVRNYRTFLKTAESVDDAKNSIDSMDAQVDILLDIVPNLTTSCQEFIDTSETIRNNRQRNRVMAEHQTQILELLEMPQLMSTCARNNLYEEALDLEEYAKGTQKRHPDIPILETIIQDMAQTSQRILQELTNLLETAIQLPACLKTIGFLRRMSVFSEKELRAEFMKRRQIFLENQLIQIPAPSQSSRGLGNTEAHEYITKYLDLNRVHLFEIITHYRAIFIDDPGDDDSGYGSGLLFRWASDRVEDIIEELERILPDITEGSLLSNILEQCMYCGLSLGHVGVDFRGLLPTLFETRCIVIFESNLENACSSFAEDMYSKDWHIAREVLSKLGITDTNEEEHDLDMVKVASEKKEKSDAVEKQKQDDDDPFLDDAPVETHLQAPQVLLEYPPLAGLTNGFINAFNELSQCAPSTIVWRICELCNSKILDISNTLRSIHDETSQDGKETETAKHAILSKLTKTSVDRFIPFVCQIIDAVYAQRNLLDEDTLRDYFDGLYEPDEEPFDIEHDFNLEPPQESEPSKDSDTSPTTVDTTNVNSSPLKNVTSLEESSDFLSEQKRQSDDDGVAEKRGNDAVAEKRGNDAVEDPQSVFSVDDDI